MKIVLVALYDIYSHGIRGLHSFLKEKGHDVSSVYFNNSTYTDKLCSNKELENLFEFVKGLNPDIVGIGVRSPLFPVFSKIAAMVGKDKVVCGGSHASGDPESLLPYAKSVVVGEGENGILAAIDGRCGIIKQDRILDLDSLPLPYYGAGTYITKALKKPHKMSIYTTRGCFFGCSYCQESILKNKPIRKSVKRVREEIDYFKSMFPSINIFTISDSVFTYNEEWLESFAKEFCGSGLSFWCSGHAQVMTNEILVLLKKAGVTSIRIGVQSGSPLIRKTVFNRTGDMEKIIEVSQNIHRLGLVGHYDFIIENPYDTPETMKETRAFIRRLPPSALINKFELRYWPGTKLTNKALSDCVIDERDISGSVARVGNWTYTYQRGA